MQGSVDVSVGYSEYNSPITQLAFSGSDSENDSSPATDWNECQLNARSVYAANTVLSAPYYTYGGSEQGSISYVNYDEYGSRFSNVRFGWRLHCTISNTWKSNGQLFKLRIGGFRSRYYNTGSPLYTWGGQWDDFGRMYFQYSESAALFTSGADLSNNFGTEDFYIDAAQFNSANRAAGRNPWTASSTDYINITLDTDYIQNMVGNDLYIWMYAPYYTYAFYAPYTYLSSVKWALNAYRIYTWY